MIDINRSIPKLGLSPCKATKRTDSLADLTPPRRTTPRSSFTNSLQPPDTPALFRDLLPALLELPRPQLGPFTSGVVDNPSSFTPTLSLPTVVLSTPIPQSSHSTVPVVVLGTPIAEESLPPTPLLPPQGHRRGRYVRQCSQSRERQFNQMVDPPFAGDLNLPALVRKIRSSCGSSILP